MALITWQDLVERSSVAGKGPIRFNPGEAEKAFNWIIKNANKLELYKTLSKEEQLKRISNLISSYIKDGKFVEGVGYKTAGAEVGFTYKAELAKNRNFAEGLRNYFESPSPHTTRTPEMIKIIESTDSLEEKYNRLTRSQRGAARTSIAKFEAARGQLSLKDFAPLTNFKGRSINLMIWYGKKNFPKTLSPLSLEHTEIARGKRFLKFLEDNGIKLIQKGDKGDIFFSDPNKAQRTALLGFLNEVEQRKISTLGRDILKKHSRQHPLYKNTSENLKTVLRAARTTLNNTIEGFNDKGLIKYLKQHPKMLKNASMWFNSDAGTFRYTSWKDLSKKGFDFEALRKNLKFELEHNRSISNYVTKMSDGESVFTKYKLLNDAEFAHNLTIDTMRYNNAKEAAVRWIENNPKKTAQITNIETELGELGHRFYAGEKWRGRQLKFKPGYKDTVMDAWTTALEQSGAPKLSKLIKDMPSSTWNLAMKEVTMKPRELRMLGNLFGCPQKFKGLDEGGRVSLATGGQGLSACVSTKLKQPGALEKIAALPEEVGGALGKLKNTATSFLGMLGRVGTKAAPLAALAVAGAGIEPLVKYFRNDDPSTYLTDESQMKGMLLATIEGETPKVDEEILKWQLPVTVAGAASAVPGSAALMAARKAKGFGLARQALGPLGKVFAGTFSPLAAAATVPLHIAAQRKAGTEWGDIATDPTHWMGAAFAGTGARMATRGMNPTGILSKALRLGYSPRVLRAFSSKLGWPGLALTGAMWGYDKWKNRSINDED